ncbi:MAG: ribulose-phosphate 3-epimerase [Pirellulales bacterium]
MRQQIPGILPSLLLCDFGQLQQEIARLEQAGVPALHLDVMDGHFVPNLSYGLPIVETCRRLTSLPLDVHLMISNPEPYLERFVEAGADHLTVHVEALEDPPKALRQIRKLGASAGLALNPKTPLSAISHLLDDCDLVLVMSVEPGFGGQAFQPVALEKLAALRQQAGERLMLAVDGGINAQTIGRCAAAGAGLFVVGSAIFKTSDYLASVKNLAQLAKDQQNC